MKRVVVTGMGLVSCLGNDLQTVTQSLRESRSGLRVIDEYKALGLRSIVAGIPDLSGQTLIDRKLRRFMGDAAVYGYYSMRDAIVDAALSAEQIESPRTGLIAGSGSGSPYEHMEAVETLRKRGMRHVPPYKVPRIMGSTVSANLSTAFGIRGISYSLGAACATSAHCIGHAGNLIRHGKQDIVFCGGAEEARWTSAFAFDAMGVLSTANSADSASRPFDASRDGFVIAGGGGVLVLESLEHAQQRNAPIRAELLGYGAASDGKDMVSPTAEAAARAMQSALMEAGSPHIDYINAHATSTRAGDLVELEAIKKVFGRKLPLISSTKGISGHPIAAAGVHEAIYGLLMMRESFVAPCANLFEPDPAAANFPLLRDRLERRIDTFMSNSFGFGGSNASLIFQRYAH